MTKKTTKQNYILKQTVKHLWVAQNTIIDREILKSSPDSVIRSISKTAFNEQREDKK